MTKQYKVKFAKDFTDGNALPGGKRVAGTEEIVDEFTMKKVQQSDPEALEPTAQLIIPRVKENQGKSNQPPGILKKENPDFPEEPGDGLVGQKPPTGPVIPPPRD